MTRPLIEAVSLHRYFGEHCAVNGIDCTLRSGEILGLLGPNGAGKSTTMRMLSGTLVPSSGSIRLNGIDLGEQPLEAKRSMGYLPERPPLYLDMTVDEYLIFCARLRGVEKHALHKTLEKTKARCGLASCGKRLSGNLSKGYRQRLGIAQAIIHDPASIILDEPTNGLDPQQILEFRELIRELGQNRGIILSTHILQEVKAICDRVLILNEGQLAAMIPLNPPPQPENRQLTIQLSNPVSTMNLEKLPGVTAVQALGENRFHLALDPTTQTRAVAEQIIGYGWGLEEFVSGQPDLEKLFIRLTQGDTST
ncbi:MAG: ATP-binding cassette domain-containing protein [Gammaproteobacteria bacterium]|nr:ATP-binding cassette domain-containing protein [Gammaproteobacteria bacterium]